MGLNVKYRIKNLEYTGENLWDLGLHKQFLDLTPKAYFIRRNNDKLDLIFYENPWEEDEKTSYKLRENICTSQIQQRAGI